MGIINATPDSFYSDSRKKSIQEAVDTAGAMIDAGAGILDIGGQSTRPGSLRINADEETHRLVPIVEAIHTAFPQIVISIDTYYSSVAFETIEAGAHIINDISGGQLDSEMLTVVGAYGNVPFICMHSKGNPQTMSGLTHYNDMMNEILQYFILRIKLCHEAGIKDVILDPGFGFAKQMQQNFDLMRNLDIFDKVNKPLLVGISRKGMIHRTLNIGPEAALNGTTVLNTVALLKGADILRVHDVKEAVEAIELIEALGGRFDQPISKGI